MRRTCIAVLLVLAITLPVCAQRRSFSTGSHGRVSVGVGSRRGGIHFGGGVSFGHNPRFNVFVGSRPHYRVRPYYRRSYVYPYIYPVYAYPFFDSFDYSVAQPYAVATPQPYVVTTPQPYYPYYPAEES